MLSVAAVVVSVVDVVVMEIAVFCWSYVEFVWLVGGVLEHLRLTFWSH